MQHTRWVFLPGGRPRPRHDESLPTTPFGVNNPPHQTHFRKTPTNMGEVSTKARICLVTTSPFIVHSFLVPLLSALSERYAVTLIANEDCSDLLKERAPSLHVRVFPIAR